MLFKLKYQTKIWGKKKNPEQNSQSTMPLNGAFLLALELKGWPKYDSSVAYKEVY